MFNFFLRPYLPGFRVKAQDDVPGFNIGENDGAPLGSAGIRVESQEDVPGFNLNESGVPRQRVPWFDEMRPGSAISEYPDIFEPEALPRDIGEPVQVTPPQLPEWLAALPSMPLPRLSTAFDPRTNQRIVPYAPLIRSLGAYQPTDQRVSTTAGTPVDDAGSLPDPGSVETPSDEVRPVPDMPVWWPADINPRSDIAPAQNSNPTSSQEAAWNAWLQPLKEGRDSNFVLAKAGNADVPSVQQQRSAPQAQETQQQDQTPPPGIMPGYVDDPGSNDALARMQLPANTRAASVPNVRGTVIASLADGGTFDGTPYPAYGANSDFGTPVGYIGRRFDAKLGNTHYRNNPPSLVDLRGRSPEGHEGARPSMSDAYPEPLIPGAQYAQVVVQPNGAVTGNPRIDRTTERLLSVLVDTVQSLGPGAGPIFGIRAHVEFGKRIEELNIPGIRDKGVEQSFSLGDAARYGLEGSVRTDVVLRDREGIPIAVYDLKTGNARLTPSRVREIRDTLRRPNIPVIELRYREESAILR